MPTPDRDVTAGNPQRLRNPSAIKPVSRGQVTQTPAPALTTMTMMTTIATVTRTSLLQQQICLHASSARPEGLRQLHQLHQHHLPYHQQRHRHVQDNHQRHPYHQRAPTPPPPVPAPAPANTHTHTQPKINTLIPGPRRNPPEATTTTTAM